ncbi:hypothetical protein EON65_47720 [archaeon]|nr:MAG: hypothetical protein EON65_47720 [archaeon]
MLFIGYFTLFVLVPVMFFLAHIWSASAASPKYFTCMMTKVRLLSPVFSCNLIEWLQYHLSMGIDHIYVANDCSWPDAQVADYLHHLTDVTGQVSLINVVPHMCQKQSKTTNMTFNNYARHDCEWVGNIDMDEFLVFRTDNASSYDFKTFLRELPHVAYRFPWWMMSTHGQEQRPPGLVIENYFSGWFEPAHIKMFAKSQFVKEWWFQLHPHFYEELENITIHGKPLTKKFQNSRADQDDYATVTINVGTGREQAIRVITAPLYIQHYRYYSYEEYILQKGKLNITAGGVNNPWHVGPRKKWEGGNITGTVIQQKFVETMAELVRKSLYQARVDNPAIAFGKCFEYWDLPHNR